MERFVKVSGYDNELKRIAFVVKGEHGSLEFWIRPERADYLGDKFYIGGVEHHYNYCPENGWYKPERPSDENCNLNCGKCWHDGSSLQASETFIPLLLSLGQDAVLGRLESEYEERMRPKSSTKKRE